MRTNKAQYMLLSLRVDRAGRRGLYGNPRKVRLFVILMLLTFSDRSWLYENHLNYVYIGDTSLPKLGEGSHDEARRHLFAGLHLETGNE
jgi:hypothetical protein